MGSFSIWHVLILLAVVLLIFGARGKIPRLMRDLGQGVTAFKKGLRVDSKPAESGTDVASATESKDKTAN